MSDRAQPWLRPWMVLVAVALLCGLLAALRPAGLTTTVTPAPPHDAATDTSVVAPPMTRPDGPTGKPPETTTATEEVGQPAVDDHPASGPSFDVVRADPHGALVVAGRAQAGAQVTLESNGKTLATGTADAAGQFVLLPETKLPAGSQTLTLASRAPGQQAVPGSAPVLLDLPAQGHPPLAVLLPRDGAMPRVLQDGTKPAAGRLGLDVVDYDTTGAVHFAGQGPPQSTVRLYVDSQAVGDARVGADGRWALTPDTSITGGPHNLRADQLDPYGRVTARIEMPFVREITPPSGLTPGRIVVQPGQSLWRLARTSYGRGVQYMVIYRANREQIANPNLIYPGQAFTIPDEFKP